LNDCKFFPYNHLSRRRRLGGGDGGAACAFGH
jgi:hypothetical protein